MPRTAPWKGIQARIVKIRDKTDGICARIGRTFVETAGICAEIGAISGKTTETFGLTVRTFGKTKERFVMTGNNCKKMNAQEPTRDSCSKIGKTSSTIVKMCEAIVGISEPTAKTGVEIVVISEGIAGICAKIGGT